MLRLIMVLAVFSTSSRPTSKDSKIENALTFINDYVANCEKVKDAIDVVDWVNSNQLATQRFKDELKRTDEEAWKKYPTTGLNADPLFDAQYYPDKGFELDSFDEKTNYLIVKGKDKPQFKLTMKIVREKGKWLVDGCGMIGIPKDKRGRR